MSYRGSCHCRNIRWETPRLPEWVTRCTCSYCRKSAAIWGRTDLSTVRITYETGRVIRYIHGDKTLAFVSCEKCGCTTHWESLEHIEPRQMKLNFATADFKLPSAIPVRLFDGADSWRYLD